MLTVDVEAATKPLGAGKNLEAALSAAEEKPREWDLSITYTRCPPGHHFIDDEGHIAPNEKKRKRLDAPPEEKKKDSESESEEESEPEEESDEESSEDEIDVNFDEDDVAELRRKKGGQV